MIRNFFETLDSNLGDEPPVMRIFIDNETWAYEALCELAPKKADEILDILRDYHAAAFSLGYTIGQSIDVSYPEIQKAIEAIKEVIREKSLLPFVPRERKAP